ncbi:MAG: GumC family protein [Acidobacteriaceae bacterium]
MTSGHQNLSSESQQQTSATSSNLSSMADHGVSAADTTLSDTVRVLRKQKWILIVAVLLGAAFGVYKSAVRPKLYIATGELQVRPGASNQFRVGEMSTPMVDSSNRLNTEVAILKSDSLMLNVARELHLQDDPVFLGAKGPVPHQDLDDPSVRQATIGRLRAGLSVSLVERTDIIEISFSSLSPSLSAQIVNTIIQDYIQRSFQTRYASTQRVSEWLSSQLDDLRQDVETSQERLMDLQKKLGVLGFDASRSQISDQLEDLTKAATDAQLQRIMAEARYRILSSTNPNSASFTEPIMGSTASASGESTILSSLRNQQTTLAAQYAQLTAQFGPNYPQVKQVRAQLDKIDDQVRQEQARLISQAKQAYTAARTNEQMTENALNNQKGDAYKLRDDMVQYTILQREFESKRELYEGLLNRLSEASIEAGLASSEIDIVDTAMIPATPTMPRRSTTILIPVIFSALAGMILAFARENLDTGLRDIAEIEAITGLPMLSIIPKVRRAADREAMSGMTAAQQNIAVLSTPKSHFAESFRSLRTSLLLSMAGHPPKTILVTSSTPSEGKTTTATNLACVLAQRDAKVLLMDADLRRPSVHHRFGLNGKTGLTTVLTGATTIEEALQRIPEVPNLDILASGPVPPFPTEMLSSEAMLALLDRLAHEYTHIVIDSPPILSVTDGIILARLCDAVVLVIRHAKSNKNIVRRTRDLLVRSGAPINGIVLNAIDLSSPDYYGYYGYYNYSYYSSEGSGWDSGDQEAGKKTRWYNRGKE